MSDRPLIATFLVTAAASCLFVLFPCIDLVVSSTFFVPGEGFAASHETFFRDLRSIGLLSINISIIVVVALTLLRCLLPKRYLPDVLAGIRPRVLVFLVAVLVIGPGIVANVLLKDHWGRARPTDILLFGGTHDFSPAWVISQACVKNCSFISGEGSGSFWFVALAFVVPVALRPAIAVYAVGWAMLVSLNRIAFGGHFLSDVLIGWGLMLIVMLILRDILLIRYGDRIDAAIARLTGR
jgi:membrane-associated PAP2 superfamily phosphatase